MKEKGIIKIAQEMSERLEKKYPFLASEFEDWLKEELKKAEEKNYEGVEDLISLFERFESNMDDIMGAIAFYTEDMCRELWDLIENEGVFVSIYPTNSYNVRVYLNDTPNMERILVKGIKNFKEKLSNYLVTYASYPFAEDSELTVCCEMLLSEKCADCPLCTYDSEEVYRMFEEEE